MIHDKKYKLNVKNVVFDSERYLLIFSSFVSVTTMAETDAQLFVPFFFAVYVFNLQFI